MKTITDIIIAHPFFKEFSSEEIAFISCCAKNKVFQQNEILAKEGTPANEFYLIKEGKVAILTSIPNRANKVIQTLGDGEMFGWSWLFPPYQWMFEAVALECTRTITFNGQCLRERLDQNPGLGFKLMKRFTQLIIARLNATRLQLLDVYGKKQ